MRIRLPGAVVFGLGIVIVAGSGCGGGGPRNCLVIPAQIDLVKERRDALLEDLEGTARRVDRQAGTLETAKRRLAELQAQEALLDSLAGAQAPRGAE